MESVQKITAMGNAYDDSMFAHQQFTAEPPYSLVSGDFHARISDHAIRVHLERSGDGFLAEIHDGVEMREMHVPDPDFSYMDHLTVEDWIRSGPAVGESIHVRTFGLQDLQSSIETYEIVFSGEKKIQGKSRKVLETSWVSSTHGDIGRITFDPEGQALWIRQGDMFEMRLEDEEQAKQTAARADFFSGGTVSIDQALGVPPEQIAGLVLHATGKVASSFRAGPGISVERTERRDSYRLTTGFHRTAKIEAAAEEISKNLEETAGYPIHDEEVLALARQAAGGAPNDEDKVREMIAFILRFLGEDSSPEILSVKETIRNRRGDCSERAALFVTLSRANGIPAREVHGLMYTSDLFRSFAGHSWCEVVLNGIWVPVDPAWGQLPVDGTHIRFGAGEKGLTQLVKMMGGLTFQLVDVELGEPRGSSGSAVETTGEPKGP